MFESSVSKWIYFSKKFLSLLVIQSLCEVLSGSKTSMKVSKSFYILIFLYQRSEELRTHWITIWTNDAVEMEHSTENIHNLIESSHLHYITNKFYNTIGFRKFHKNDKNNQKFLSFWQKWIFNGKWFHSKKTVRIKTTNIFLEHSIFHRFQQKFS